MSAVVGTLLVLVGILLFAWATTTFRDPNGPRWRNNYLALESVACAIVAALTFGLALQLQYALAAQGVMAAMLTLGVVAFLVVARLVVWRVLDVKAKLARLEAAEVEQVVADVKPAAKRA